MSKIEDQSAVRRGMKYFIFCICLFPIGAMTNMFILFCLGFLGMILVGVSVGVRTDRIKFENGYIYCQSPKFKSEYVSFLGNAKMPIDMISSVNLYECNQIEFNRYYLEFFDNAGHKLAKMPLNWFTSQEYLEKLKAKFQSLNIECITNIPFLENEAENVVQSDTPQRERERQITTRRRNIPQQVASDNSPIEKKERKRGRHIDLD